MSNDVLEQERINSIKNDKGYLAFILNFVRSQIDKNVTRVEVYGIDDDGRLVKFKAYRPKGDSEEYILVGIANLD